MSPPARYPPPPLVGTLEEREAVACDALFRYRGGGPRARERRKAFSSPSSFFPSRHTYRGRQTWCTYYALAGSGAGVVSVAGSGVCWRYKRG